MFAAGKAASGAEPTDAQFNYVTMLLHGNGTNGAQNNTFVDSSTNNFVITRNGNTTQGTFSPYGSNWSNYFDGSGDYLSVADANALDFAGDFTVEAWVFVPTTSASARTIIHKADTNVGYALVMIPAGNIEVQCTSLQFNSTSTLPLNQWNHVAMVRSGSSTNNVKFYLNGVLDGQGTNTTDTASSVTLGIGAVARSGAAGVNPLNGYISNVRTVASAVYTSAFTPSTTPLTAITNTSLLTCQSNRFIDNSTNAYTITKNGDTSVQRFSPFSPTSAYSTSVIGGSGYFDGSGDYLSVSNTGLFGSGDWTFECWVNAPVGQTDKPIIDARNSAGGFGSTTGFTITMITSTEIRVWSNGEKIRATANYVNQWLHIALVKSGSTTTMYFNGVSVGTTTGIGTMSDTSFLVGAGYYGSTSINAYGNFYTSNMRVVKGSAVYTSNFTPPTAPVTAITSTALLMDYTNAGILDNAMMNDLETVGNAQISTSVKKYGTGSMSFDGTDDRLTSATSPNIAFGTGDFTVEAWINTNTLAGERGFIQTSATTGGLQTSYTNGIVIIFDASPNLGRIVVNVGGTNLNSGTTLLSTGVWYHLALTRSSGSVRLFINGTVVGGPTTVTANLDGQNICVGGYYSTAYLWNGYIDDLRITKGYARYTSNFTPPTAAFPNN